MTYDLKITAQQFLFPGSFVVNNKRSILSWEHHDNYGEHSDRIAWDLNTSTSESGKKISNFLAQTLSTTQLGNLAANFLSVLETSAINVEDLE